MGEFGWPPGVYYACSSTYRHCVALAAQGRYPEVEYHAQVNPLGDRNGKKAFKEMGILDLIGEFELAFQSLLRPQLPKLKRLSDLSPGIVGEKPFGPEYVVLFNELSSSTFEGAYKSLVQPIATPNKAF